MKSLVLLLFAVVLCEMTVVAQSSTPAPIAIETIQQSQSPKVVEAAPTASLESPVKPPVTVKLPAGTPIDVEVGLTGILSAAWRVSAGTAGVPPASSATSF